MTLSEFADRLCLFPLGAQAKNDLVNMPKPNNNRYKRFLAPEVWLTKYLSQIITATNGSLLLRFGLDRKRKKIITASVYFLLRRKPKMT
jgi:hypothetical protein